MIRKNVNLILLALLLDLISLLLAIILAYGLRLALPFGRYLPNEPYIFRLILEAVLIYSLVFGIFAIYDPDQIRTPVDENLLLTKSCFVAGLALAGLVYFTVRDISRLLLIYIYVLHFLSVLGWRTILQTIHKTQYERGHSQGKVLLIGGGEAALRVIDRLNQPKWSGLSIVGYLTDGKSLPLASTKIPNLGDMQDVQKIVQEYSIDHVLIAFTGEFYEPLQVLVAQLTC
jgi:FlaA1/EpsC-like NDP-sugar epimerase